MHGRICLITGTASGMGKIAARELAKQGAVVIGVDNDASAGRASRDEIATLAGHANVEFLETDISDFGQVRRLAERVRATFGKLHVLICNAGLVDPVYRANPEGFEIHLATHHLGHFLLANLLTETMAVSSPARMIFICSDAHKAGPGIDWDDMDCARVWAGRPLNNRGAFIAYHRAKLAMIYTAYEFAERLMDKGVTVNAVSPGYFVGTNIYRNMRGLFGLGCRILKPFFTDPERAAQTYVYLAASPDVAGVTGKYWEYCKQKASSSLSHDLEQRRRCWAWSEAAIGLD